MVAHAQSHRAQIGGGHHVIRRGPFTQDRELRAVEIDPTPDDRSVRGSEGHGSGAARIGNPVPLPATARRVGVIAPAPGHPVRARPTNEGVTAIATVEHVITRLPTQGIPIRTPRESIIAFPPIGFYRK